MIPLIGPFFWKRRSLYSELEADERRDALPAEQIAEVMEPVYLRGDRILTVLLLAHAALAVTLAFVYGTWLIALAVGGIALALFIPAAAFLPGRLLTRCLAGISLQAFVLLHIYQMHGLAEMHFLFFAACTIMIVYQDWRCLWPGTLLFALLAQAGRPFHLLGDSLGDGGDISAVKLCVQVGVLPFPVLPFPGRKGSRGTSGDRVRKAHGTTPVSSVDAPPFPAREGFKKRRVNERAKGRSHSCLVPSERGARRFFPVPRGPRLFS